jgi:hypothetical protein
MNAQPLRYMDIALMNVIGAELHGVAVRVPHPACFALHKLLVAPRRPERERGNRDSEMGIHVLELLAAQGEVPTVTTLFERFQRPWRADILKELARLERSDICAAFRLVK